MVANSHVSIGPNKVYYSDDPIYRNRKLVYRHTGAADYYPHDLGMVKGTHWSYEHEWRFKIAALAFETQMPDDNYLDKVTLDFMSYPIETSALFIPLEPSALDELEVTVGPKTDNATVKAVERILTVYAPHAKLVRSHVRVR